MTPFVHSRDHREGRGRCYDGNGDDLHRGADRNSRPQVVDAGVDLRHRQPECRGDTEQGSKDGKYINDVTDGTVNPLSHQRIERRPDRQRQAVTKGEVRQHQAHQAVYGPDMETPVEEGNLHGLFGRVDGFRRTDRRGGIVQDRFRHTEEQQRNTITSRKQHGEPFGKTVLRLGMIRPQLDIAPARGANCDYKYQENGYRQHVKPAEGFGNPRQGRTESLPGQFGIAYGTDHQQQGNRHRRKKYRHENG